MIRIILIFLLLFPSLAWGSTCTEAGGVDCTKDGTVYTCTDAKYECVNAAVAAATSGDTINISADTETWGSRITIGSAVAAKGLTIHAGIGGATTITCTAVGAFYSYGGADRLEISGFTFIADGDYVIDVWGQYHCNGATYCENAVNIHHNSFTYGTIRVMGYLSGVIHANTFTHTDEYNAIRLYLEPNTEGGPSKGYDGGSLAWTRDTDLGTNKFIFIENNSFISTGTPNVGTAFIDGRSGLRYVARYNTTKNIVWGHHSAEIGKDRGTRAFEIYNNLVEYDANINGWLYPTRGGTGVIYNNRIKGTTFTGSLTLITNPRGEPRLDPWDVVCSEEANKFCLGGPAMGCSSDEDCTGTINGYAVTGPCVLMDGSGASGRQCRDQWGAGKVNATTGVHAVEPVLLWNNKYCTGAGGECDADAGTLFGVTTAVATILENADYCDKTCTGGDNAGKGCTVATQETDCPGVGGGTCSLTSSQASICGGVTLSYSKYTCPHPLAGPGSCDSATAGRNGYHLGNANFGSGSTHSWGSGATHTFQ